MTTVTAAEAVTDIAAAVRTGECILFLGAGVHCGPPAQSPFRYPEELRPPFGSELSQQLADGCHFVQRLPRESTRNLPRVAMLYEIEHKRRRLVDAIETAVETGKQPSPALRALAELDFPLIVTTNYDSLFERALLLAGKRPQTVVYTPKPEVVHCPPPSVRKPVVFKIHGDLAQRDSVVVTDEDYIQFILRMSSKDPYDPVPLAFRYRFMEWTTLFVGYSLLDYNLRVLFKALRWRIDPANIPEMYSVDLHPDPLVLEVWQDQHRYVNFIAEDVWAFVPELYRTVRGKEMPAYDG